MPDEAVRSNFMMLKRVAEKYELMSVVDETAGEINFIKMEYLRIAPLTTLRKEAAFAALVDVHLHSSPNLSDDFWTKINLFISRSGHRYPDAVDLVRATVMEMFRSARSV